MAGFSPLCLTRPPEPEAVIGGVELDMQFAGIQLNSCLQRPQRLLQFFILGSNLSHKRRQFKSIVSYAVRV